jgi:3-hydroxyisobutyrate dehydrogenase-like beta-hydroxyacid dehydrogenase
MTEIATIGFIGLGVMGEPMCHNLHRKSGKTVIAFDLNTETLARASAEGMQIARDLVDVAQRCDAIFTSLPGGNELRQVADALLPHLRHGQILVDTTTAPVALTRTIAEEFAEEGVAYADAPIARTRQAARDGTLSVMVGAKADVYTTIEPLIACYATDITHCGDIGSGQVVKILNNMVLVETVHALAEALTIGRRAGVDGAVLFDTLAKGSADSFALRNHGMKAMLPGVFPNRAFSAKYALKDLSYAQELAGETGVNASGAKLAASLLQATIDKGLGDAYWPALLAVIDETLEPETPDQG